MRRSGTGGDGWSRWRCCSARNGSCAAASATSRLVRLVIEPAGLGGQPGWALDTAAGPAPGLGDAAAAQGPEPKLAQGVSHPLATGTPAPAGQLGRIPRLAPVLDDERQRLGEADLPPGVDMHRRPGPRSSADEVHAAEERLLLKEGGRTDGAFHDPHTTPGG